MERRRAEVGFTLIEVVVAVVVVGVIAGALAQTFMSGFRTTTAVGHHVTKTDDSQRIATYWTRDVQSVDVDGVNPSGVTCGSGGTTVVTFRWVADGGASGGDNVTTTVTWAGVGSGTSTKLVRRVCTGTTLGTPVSTRFVAGDFMDASTTVGGAVTGTCTTATCTITLAGTLGYRLTIDRRSQPVGTATSTSGANLFAISNVPNSTQIWTVGLGCGLYFYGGSGSASRITLPSSLCSNKNLYGIVAVETAVFAVGDGGLILRCASSCTTAANWFSVTSPTTNTLYAVTAVNIAGTGTNTGRARTGLVAVGANGTVVKCKNADCSSAAATWTQVPTTGANADLAGQTLTSVAATAQANAGPTNSTENSLVLIAARGTAPSDATKGRLIKCTGSCWSGTPAWAFATSTLPASSGQLSAVAAFPNAGSGLPAFAFAVGDAGKVLTCYNCMNFTLLGAAQPQALVATAVTDGSSGKSSSDFGTLAVGAAGEIASCEGTVNTTACKTTLTIRTSFVGFQVYGATRTNQTSNSSTNATAYLVGSGGLVKVTNLNNAFQATCTATTTPIKCETIPLP